MMEKRLSLIVLFVLLTITACGVNKPAEMASNIITRENVKSLTQIRSLEKMGISEITWISDGLSFAFSKDGHEISVINTQTLKEEQSFTSPSDLYQKPSISPKGDRVAIITDEYRKVEIWNIKPQELVMTLGDDENSVWVNITSFSPDGNSLVTGGWGEEGADVKLWDLNSGGLSKEIKLVEVIPAWVWGVYNLVVSPDGKGLAALAYDGSLHVYYDDWSFSAPGDGGEAQGAALAFSPDGDLLAVGGGSFANNLLIYDLSTTWPEVIFDLEEPKGIVRNVSFNADGSIIAATVNGAVLLWDVETGELLYQLDHKPYATNVAFSPDGTLLATSGYSDSLRIWGIPEP
jgi:WD40 repeat protein